MIWQTLLLVYSKRGCRTARVLLYGMLRLLRVWIIWVWQRRNNWVTAELDAGKYPYVFPVGFVCNKSLNVDALSAQAPSIPSSFDFWLTTHCWKQKWSSQSHHSCCGLNFRTVFYLVAYPLIACTTTCGRIQWHLQLSTVHWVTPELSEWRIMLLGHLIHHQCSNPKFCCGNPCLCILKFLLLHDCANSSVKDSDSRSRIFYGHYAMDSWELDGVEIEICNTMFKCFYHLRCDRTL